MNVLVVHQSFPGQFFYLAPYLAQQSGHKVFFLAKENSVKTNFAGVALGLFQEPPPVPDQCHPYLRPAMEAVMQGQQVLRSIRALKDQAGFVPDVVVGHTGWGALLYIKDLYPDMPVLGYFEWFYHGHGGDSEWWPDEKLPIDALAAIRTKNAHHYVGLGSCDLGYTPTKWQYSQFPEEFKPKIELCHDGIDTNFCKPADGKKPGLVLDDIKLNLPAGTEIVTYVSRGFEGFRGFPQFMDAMRIVLQHRPKCHVIIVGADRVCYGPKLPDSTFKEAEEKKGGYDEKRLHFVGLRNRGDYRKILQASSVHVYLTRPFILSWSMLESMSFGCSLVGSMTPPVEEVVEDGVNGLLADFRSPSHIARRVEEILDDKKLAKKLGKAARETVLERYELLKCLRKQEDMLYRITNKKKEL